MERQKSKNMIISELKGRIDGFQYNEDGFQFQVEAYPDLYDYIANTFYNLCYFRQMRILLATECGGHPFWQRNKYDFTMLDTESETATKLNFSDLFNNKSENWQYGEVEYYIRKDGVYARFFACGSGFGKVPRGDEFLLIARDEYDKVIILPNEEKRKAEHRYEGNWQNNSDFD